MNRQSTRAGGAHIPFSRVFALGLILVFGLSPAAYCGGGSETKVATTPVTTTPTLGKQLEDLEVAYKKGAISQAEYETAKKNLIEQGAQSK